MLEGFSGQQSRGYFVGVAMRRAVCVIGWFAAGVALGQAPSASTYPTTAYPKPTGPYQYHFESVTIPRPAPDEVKIPFSPRLAVDYIEQGALAWTGEWKCVACHTNGSYMVVRPMLTAELGPPQTALRDFFVEQLKQYDTDRIDDRKATQVVYIAAGLAMWDAHVGHRLSPETVEALALMFRLQQTEGNWFVDDDNNPPLESSAFQVATVAARAVANAPGWMQSQRGKALGAKVDLLKQYLRRNSKMQGDYDLTDLLWTASEWKGLLSPERTHALIAMVEAHQKLDGGWSIRTFARPEEWGKGNRADKLRQEIEFGDPPSDGHMTGLAIIALREAGVPASEPHVRAGVAWLLENQRSSGRWYTRSLNRDGHQFISYSATAYPLLALKLCWKLPDVRVPFSETAGGSRDTEAVGSF